MRILFGENSRLFTARNSEWMEANCLNENSIRTNLRFLFSYLECCPSETYVKLEGNLNATWVKLK